MTKLTDEQKMRFAPMLHATWQAIGFDAKEGIDPDSDRVEQIVEITCDANRPEMYGGMSREEYDVLCAAYNDPDTQAWLKITLNYC